MDRINFCTRLDDTNLKLTHFSEFYAGFDIKVFNMHAFDAESIDSKHYKYNIYDYSFYLEKLIAAKLPAEFVSTYAQASSYVSCDGNSDRILNQYVFSL